MSVFYYAVPLFFLCFFARADFVDEGWSAVALPTPPPTAPVTPGPATGAAADSTGTTATPTPQKNSKKTSEKQDKNLSSHEKNQGLFGSDVTHFDSQAPLKIINADELEGSQRNGFVVLTGHVHLAQADTSIKSDRAHIYFEATTKQAHRAVAKGNVKIQKKPSDNAPSLHATADEIEFFVKTRKAVLRGKPKIWRGDEVMQGQIMELDLNSGQVRVRGVSGLLDPHQSSPPIPKKAP